MKGCIVKAFIYIRACVTTIICKSFFPSYLVHKREIMVQAFLAQTVETGDRIATCDLRHIQFFQSSMNFM